MAAVAVGFWAWGLAGCSQAEPVDQATPLAMTACGISEESNADGSVSFVPADDDGSSWSWDDPVESLRELEERLRDAATSAEAAAQIDSQWKDLASATSSNYAFVDQIVRVRENLRSNPTSDDIRRLFPDFGDRGARYNSDLARVEVICDALVVVLNAGS